MVYGQKLGLEQACSMIDAQARVQLVILIDQSKRFISMTPCQAALFRLEKCSLSLAALTLDWAVSIIACRTCATI